MPAFAIQLNIFWNSIIFKKKKADFFASVVRRPINISALMMTVKETFLGVAGVIFWPATCVVSIAGEHFFVCQWKSC